MDSLGKQLVDEEADIVAEVKNIVKSRATIKFAPWLSSGNILHDFDIDEAYVNYQKSVVNEQSVDEIKKAGKKGFRCAVCTVGGSMKATTERLFKHFDISTGENGIIQYFYDEEDSQYHQIGQIKGENFGVDPTKKQIYTTIGAQDKLLNNEADIVFIWDPDGDRFNMVTMASADRSDQYTDFGLEVEPCPGTDKCIVYFTPNQIFFMLTAFRIVSLKASKIFYTYDWFLASSVTTSRALDELAESENIPVVHVRVGFKHWGTFASWLENRDNETEVYVTALREKIQLGKNPRLIIMCEESGGAVFGGSELLMNKNGTQELIGMREKDGFQFGLLTLSLASFLYNRKQTFADHYCEQIDNHKIKHKYFKRYDRRLYDESLTGIKRQEAKVKGIKKRDQIMEFFRNLAVQYSTGKSSEKICNEMNSKIAKGDKALPQLKRLSLIGEGSLLEGTFFEFNNFWFVIRASGTDAVLRYYLDGENREEIESYQKSLVNMLI
jgi:phosphomannomutase